MTAKELFEVAFAKIAANTLKAGLSMNAMNYKIHGVEIRASMVHHRDNGTADVFFSHDIAIPDRERLANAGVPVFYDMYTNFRYMTVDTSLLSGNMDNKLSVKKCECGSSSVGASRHSTWCPFTV